MEPSALSLLVLRVPTPSPSPPPSVYCGLRIRVTLFGSWLPRDSLSFSGK